MPELPEVETVVRDLRAEVVGRTIVAVPHGASSVFRCPAPEVLAALLPGGSFDSVRRLGKYILCELSREGEGVDREALIVHLGMTGHLEVCDAAAPERPHTHLRALLDDGRELRFADARRFGRVIHGAPVALRAARPVPVVGVLEIAIRNRGSTIDDYRDLWNAEGGHQEELRVYGRGGQPCMRCGTVLRRTVVAGRTTAYCPACQR